jgi:hypothetical protein
MMLNKEINVWGMCGVVEMNKEAEWAKTAPYCELHRPTRRYTHSIRNIVFPILKRFRGL